MIKFQKTLAKYYHHWLDNCIASEIYLKDKGELIKAEEYRRNAEELVKLIDENKEAIEFFSIGDNAFIKDRCIPEQFRGME